MEYDDCDEKINNHGRETMTKGESEQMYQQNENLLLA
jgi:hypothetical protein